MKNTFLGLACLLAVSLGLSALAVNAEAQESSASAPRDNANAWSFDIAPYLWLAGYDGTVGLPNLPSGIPEVPTESADPFGTHISAAAMLTARVRYRDIGLLIDDAWLQLKTEGSLESGLYSSEEIKSDIGYGTLALSYRLPCPGKLTTDIFAGARLWYISNEIEFKPGIAQGFTAEKSRLWVDPILGASLRYDLTRHWYGTVLGDVGFRRWLGYFLECFRRRRLPIHRLVVRHFGLPLSAHRLRQRPVRDEWQCPGLPTGAWISFLNLSVVG
jgi:hypothetical protein